MVQGRRLAHAETPDNGKATTADMHECPESPPQPPSKSDLAKYLKHLSPEKHLQLLEDAALHHPDVSLRIKAEYEQGPGRNDHARWDGLVSTADYELNTKYTHLSDREQKSNCHHVSSRLDGLLLQMTYSVREETPFETKFNVLDCILGIFKLVLECDHPIGHEMRSKRRYVTWWGKVYLLPVIAAFRFGYEWGEVRRMPRGGDGDDGGLWLDEFARVAGLADVRIDKELRMREALWTMMRHDDREDVLEVLAGRAEESRWSWVFAGGVPKSSRPSGCIK